VSAGLHICWTQYESVRIARVPCLDCASGYRYGRRVIPPRQGRPFGVIADSPWYDSEITCLRCGDRWAGGEGFPRPFAPRWREENVESARKLWRRHNNPGGAG